MASRQSIGFAGRLSEEKGLRLLLTAAERLPNVSFRVAGSGPLAEELQRHVEQRNVDNVRFLGHLDQRTLRAEIASWRMSIVPSLFDENCPYAVLDSLACGTPVVAANTGGIGELLPSGGGTLFQRGDALSLSDAIERVVDDIHLLERWSRSGIEFVRDACSPEAHLDRLVDCLLAVQRFPS
jgi:glycosyltransferase involved in cell wall biosynthesis